MKLIDHMTRMATTWTRLPKYSVLFQANQSLSKALKSLWKTESDEKTFFVNTRKGLEVLEGIKVPPVNLLSANMGPDDDPAFSYFCMEMRMRIRQVEIIYAGQKKPNSLKSDLVTFNDSELYERILRSGDIVFAEAFKKMSSLV
jgi:hypothetical protein